jgi:hypothetical protein
MFRTNNIKAYGTVWYMVWYMVWYNRTILPRILCHPSYISESRHYQQYRERICQTNLTHLYEVEAGKESQVSSASPHVLLP